VDNTERMRINSTGVVSIGNTENTGYSDDYLVQVGTDGAGSNSFGMLIRANESGTSKLGFADGNDADATGKVWYDHSSNYMRFDTDGSEAMRIDSSGNVLVGTTSTSATSSPGIKNLSGGRLFTVATYSDNTQESLSMYSTGASAYRFYVGWGGTIYATSTSISAISDIRYKENVRDLDDGLSKIMALQPRKFDWKEGKGRDVKNDRGWIAQEIETVFPDLVDEWKDEAPEGEEPYKSVRPDLIPVLVKAIQEQQAIIESLTARITTLEG
jgi:hypothetical protein